MASSLSIRPALGLASPARVSIPLCSTFLQTSESKRCHRAFYASPIANEDEKKTRPPILKSSRHMHASRRTPQPDQQPEPDKPKPSRRPHSEADIERAAELKRKQLDYALAKLREQARVTHKDTSQIRIKADAAYIHATQEESEVGNRLCKRLVQLLSTDAIDNSRKETWTSLTSLVLELRTRLNARLYYKFWATWSTVSAPRSEVSVLHRVVRVLNFVLYATYHTVIRAMNRVVLLIAKHMARRQEA